MHAGDDHHLSGFPGHLEALSEGVDDGIASDGSDGRHVQHAAYLGTPAPDDPLAPLFAAVIGQGGETRECGDPFAVEGAQFGQFGEQGRRGLASRVAEVVAPTPGMLRRRSSFVRQAGLARNRCLKSVSISSMRLSNQAMWLLRLFCCTFEARPKRRDS